MKRRQAPRPLFFGILHKTHFPPPRTTALTPSTRRRRNTRARLPAPIAPPQIAKICKVSPVCLRARDHRRRGDVLGRAGRKRAAVATEEHAREGDLEAPLKNIERGSSVLKSARTRGVPPLRGPSSDAPGPVARPRRATRRARFPRSRASLSARTLLDVFVSRDSASSPTRLPRGPRSMRRAARAPLASLERGSNIPDAIAHRTRPPAAGVSPRPPRHEPGYGEDPQFRIKFTHKDKKISPWQTFPTAPPRTPST